jgi:hypothetical protein
MKYQRCEVCGAYLEGPDTAGEITDGRCPACGGIITPSEPEPEAQPEGQEAGGK